MSLSYILKDIHIFYLAQGSVTNVKWSTCKKYKYGYPPPPFIQSMLFFCRVFTLFLKHIPFFSHKPSVPQLYFFSEISKAYFLTKKKQITIKSNIQVWTKRKQQKMYRCEMNFCWFHAHSKPAVCGFKDKVCLFRGVPFKVRCV